MSGINANGTGPQVSLPITWTSTGTPPPTGPVPTCTLESDNNAPKTGDVVTLKEGVRPGQWLEPIEQATPEPAAMPTRWR